MSSRYRAAFLATMVVAQGCSNSPTSPKLPKQPNSNQRYDVKGAGGRSQPRLRADTLTAFLVRQKLSHKPTAGYKPLPLRSNPLWHHVHSVRSSTQPLEIRYGLALSGFKIQLHQECRGNAACERAPSDVAVRRLLGAAVAKLAKGGKTKRVKPFPMDAVRKEFNAHWGGVVLFEPAPQLAGQKQALAVVIYRQGRGAAVFMGLYDVYTQALGNEWMRAFHSLRFSKWLADPKSVAQGQSLINTRWRCGKGFVHMRFLETTWQVLHVSVAMAAMGQMRPYEQVYSNITYLPKGAFRATIFRIDNMERGDRTPKNPKTQTYTFSLTGRTLSVVGPKGKVKWTCKR